MTVRGGIWRLLAGVASVGVALKMAERSGEAFPQAWPHWTLYAWAFTILVLILFGVGTLAQVVSPLLGGEEVRWFPSRPERAGRQGFWGLLGAGGSILVAVLLVIAIWPVLAGRAAAAGLGVFLCFLAVAQSRGFWDVAGVQGWRWLLGDRVVQLFYLLLGFAFIAAAIFVRV